jgi:FtsP/CotA-like multicopper oxidase with cupredoxin domain
VTHQHLVSAERQPGYITRAGVANTRADSAEQRRTPMSERTPSGPAPGQPPREATTGVLQVVQLEAAEHDWEISPGMVVHGYAFNGQTPGPVIEARVGDALLVQFTNLLPEPTTIRWPGLPQSVNSSELAADLVPSGGRVQYQLHLPHAGTFWYHSPVAATIHSSGTLCGVLVVRDPVQPALGEERVLLFSDLELNPRGGPGGPDQLLLADRYGPKGEVLLVNGVLGPEMQIETGHVERWRLVNTSAYPLRLSLGGHRFDLIRTRSATPHAVDEVLMAPSDRLDLAVGPFPHGETVVLEALPYDPRVSESLHRALATLYVAPPDRPSEAPGVDLGVMARPRTHGVAVGGADLDFSSRGMDTLKSRALDREEG